MTTKTTLKKIKEEFEEKFPVVMLEENVPLAGNFVVVNRNILWSFIKNVYSLGIKKGREEEKKELKELYLRGGNPWKVIDKLTHKEKK